MPQEKGFASGIQSILDKAVPLMIHKQNLDASKATAAQAQAIADRKFKFEVAKTMQGIQAEQLKTKIAAITPLMESAIKNMDTGAFQGIAPQMESLTGAQFPKTNVAPMEESPEMMYQLPQLKPDKENLPNTVESVIARMPVTIDNKIAMVKKLKASETKSEIPTSLKEFEIRTYGKLVPERRGTVGYKEDQLTYLKDKQTATTAASKTEPAVLRKEFINQSKDFVKVRDAYNRIKASFVNPSAAGDLSMIFNYMKVLDPGSVVRESEFATAAAAGSYGERIKAQVARVMRGERLSDEMREDFRNRAEMLYTEQEASHNQLRDEYDRLAKGLGVEPSNVLIKYATEQARKETGKNVKTSIAPETLELRKEHQLTNAEVEKAMEENNASRDDVIRAYLKNIGK